jgi:hypothetical protein
MAGRPSVNRAVPASIIDLIHDGVPEEDLRGAAREQRDRLVWGALLKTANSYQQRGQLWSDWHSALADPRSELGRQARLTFKVWPGKPRKDPLKQLRDAWAKTQEYLADVEPAAAPNNSVALDAIEAQLHLIGNESDRKLMRHALNVGREYNSMRVILPKWVTIEKAELGETAVRNGFRRLGNAGWLVLVERGKPGAGSGKASVYLLGLPAAHLVPAPRTGGPHYSYTG